MMRTMTCGQLNVKSLDREVALTGWVDTYRDHGDIVFIDIRDRWGVTQVVFDKKSQAKVHDESKSLRCEFVIRVKGLETRSGFSRSGRIFPSQQRDHHQQ